MRDDTVGQVEISIVFERNPVLFRPSIFFPIEMEQTFGIFYPKTLPILDQLGYQHAPDFPMDHIIVNDVEALFDYDQTRILPLEKTERVFRLESDKVRSCDGIEILIQIH